MIRYNAEKVMKQFFVLILFLVMLFIGINVVKADSAQLDSNGQPFVLGKGGARMSLKSHKNAKAIVVGKLGSQYVAMLNHNEVRVPELDGKLFLVDNVTASGTCTWDGNKSSIISVEGINLNNMRYYHHIWGHSYMQMFWFDMRDRFGDKSDLWAVSNSCESNVCHVFKYTEKYDETAKCIAERKLTYKNQWTFGNCVKGIDVIDLNSATVGAKESNRRCPPIFVEVSRPYGTSNGRNGDFWGVASEIWFKNIKMKNGVPELDQFGRYATNYKALSGYDRKSVMPSKNKSTDWGGICGGGFTALGAYKDTGKPTWAYYTMSSKADIHWEYSGFEHKSFFYYSWDLYSTKHTFEYDHSEGSEFRKFTSVDSKSYSCSRAREKSSSIDSFVKDLFSSCSSVLFDCKGPKIVMNEAKEMFVQGKEMNGSKIGGYIGDKFKTNNNQFVGQISTKKTKSDKREFVDKGYAQDAKGQALKNCDEQGRQVLAIFLGYPYTALRTGESPNPVKVFMNFQNVKTEGVETGTGASAEWSAGIGGSSKVAPIEAHAGYKAYINEMITKGHGTEFSSTVGDSITFNKDNIWNDRHKGIVFFDCKNPSLSVGGLVWKNGEIALVPGWDSHKRTNYHVIPIAGGVFSNHTQVYSSNFSLYDTAKTWDKDECIYSPLTDGLECKSLELAELGNLFEFNNEAELESIVNNAKDCNYEILSELKSNANEDVKAENDTFKDRAVKWLTPVSSPDRDFGYDWKRSRNWSMDFSKFTNRSDEVNEGHGGYWKFNIGFVESEGSIVTRNSNRTYANTSTKNGYGFETSQVNNLTRNYQVKYYGFMVNPRVYKEVQMNKGSKAERPGFIPEYCWDRNQSFALFVPAVYGSFAQIPHNYI